MNSGLFNQVLLMFLNEKKKYFTIPGHPASYNLHNLILLQILQSNNLAMSGPTSLTGDRWRGGM